MVKDWEWNCRRYPDPGESSMFQLLPLRWIVERTFSWIENYVSMTTDEEYKAEFAEAML